MVAPMLNKYKDFRLPPSFQYTRLSVGVFQQFLLLTCHGFVPQKSQLTGSYTDFLPQRAKAAFLAICIRFLGDSFSARALPPFKPPNLPRATAAGFFSRSDDTSPPPVTMLDRFCIERDYYVTDMAVKGVYRIKVNCQRTTSIRCLFSF